MSLFDNTTDAATNAANQLRTIIKQQFSQLGMNGRIGYDLIWSNSNATPQDVVAALGTDAKLIFQLAVLNLNTVNEASTLGGIDAPVIPSVPTGWTLTDNGDGSLTAVPPTENTTHA